MNKKLNYVPIYKGEYNMTPEEYANQQLAQEYVNKNQRVRESKSDFCNELIKFLILVGCSVAVFFAAV